jgi:hypothetical protein
MYTFQQVYIKHCISAWVLFNADGAAGDGAHLNLSVIEVQRG